MRQKGTIMGVDTSLGNDAFFLFNTKNSISSDAGEEGLFAVRSQAQAFEAMFSRTNTESELYRANRAKRRKLPVSAQLAELVERALAYCSETGGLFDITMAPVVELWDFKNRRVADEEAVREALTHVGWKGVSVRGTHLCIEDPKAGIDLGGIAKGYMADRFLETLRAHGGRHSLVNLGGNVSVAGGRPDGSPWRIGIRKPWPSRSNPLDEMFALLEIENGSVVTSGVYERAFEQDGRLYHHILDPETGFPAQTDLLSATVVSRDSIDGDAFATALVLMGADQAIAFAERHPRIEAVLLTDEGDVLATSGIGRDVAFRITA